MRLVPCGTRGSVRGLAVIVTAGLILSPACAKKLPPPGGKPDQEPPSVIATSPDSGSTRVARSGSIEVEFSEPMNQRASNNWILLTPYVRPRKIKWDGKTFRYELADSLEASRTYSLIVGRGARDIRGNLLRNPRTVHFTTADSFPAGSIEGKIEGRGHTTRDVFVWAYREDLGHTPDSTAFDFDALSVTAEGGEFSLLALEVPSRWRLYAFHDINRTLTFEPGSDHLTEYPEIVELTRENPRVDTLRLLSLDPRAPGRVEGVVVDSLAPPGILLGLVAERITEEATRREVETHVAGGPFQLPLDAGHFRLWIFLDLNRDGKFDRDGEPISEVLEVTLTPGLVIKDVVLVAPALPPAGEGEGPGGP